jgi:hypothetical protein
MLTNFESFEHFDRPLKELRKLLEIGKNIFFSTTLIPIPYPEPDKWWCFGLEHGQHIAFSTSKTLTKIAEIFGLNIYTNNSFLHLLTEKKMNQKLFIVCIKNSYRTFNKTIRRNLTSKTVSDSEMIKHILLESNQ